jgi:hypothetical protein
MMGHRWLLAMLLALIVVLLVVIFIDNGHKVAEREARLVDLAAKCRAASYSPAQCEFFLSLYAGSDGGGLDQATMTAIMAAVH